MLPPVRIAPSILSADHGRLAAEVQAAEAAGADWIHLDVMDGHFVPNLTFGPPVIKSLRKSTRLPFDVHLMIERPELSLSQYVDAGADLITVHAEATVHLHRTLGAIKHSGVRAGVSLNPATPLSAIAYVLELVDLVLVMSVNPGFGGQKFIPAVVPKIEVLRATALARQIDMHIAVDGGVDATVAPDLRGAGADVFVAGSAIFHSVDYAASIHDIRQAATRTPYWRKAEPLASV